MPTLANEASDCSAQMAIPGVTGPFGSGLLRSCSPRGNFTNALHKRPSRVSRPESSPQNGAGGSHMAKALEPGSRSAAQPEQAMVISYRPVTSGVFACPGVSNSRLH